MLYDYSLQNNLLEKKKKEKNHSSDDLGVPLLIFFAYMEVVLKTFLCSTAIVPGATQKMEQKDSLSPRGTMIFILDKMECKEVTG